MRKKLSVTMLSLAALVALASCSSPDEGTSNVSILHDNKVYDCVISEDNINCDLNSARPVNDDDKKKAKALTLKNGKGAGDAAAITKSIDEEKLKALTDAINTMNSGGLL